MISVCSTNQHYQMTTALPDELVIWLEAELPQGGHRNSKSPISLSKMTSNRFFKKIIFKLEGINPKQIH